MIDEFNVHHGKLELYNDHTIARNNKALARWAYLWHARGGSRNSTARSFQDLRSDSQQGHWMVMLARADRVRAWAREKHQERERSRGKQLMRERIERKVVSYRAKVRPT